MNGLHLPTEINFIAPCPVCDIDIELGDRKEAFSKVGNPFRCPECHTSLEVIREEDRSGDYWFVLEKIS